MSVNSMAIAIPTYNRAPKIQDFLERSCESLYGLGVAIYISDNCSSDNTKEVVEKYQQKYSNIYYTQQENNLGFLRNFEYVLHWPDSDYVWFCGDDDLIDLSQIDRAISAIQDNPEMVVVNGGDKIKNVTRVPLSVPDKVYTDKDEVLGELGYHMSWMSVLIFSKKMIDSISFLPYEWTAFPHLCAIFDYFSLCNKLKVIYLSSLIVSYNSVGSTGDSYNDKILIYFCDHWNKMCNHFKKIYSDKAVDKFRFGHRNNIIDWGVRGFINYRIQGYFNHSEFLTYKKLLPILTTGNIFAIEIISICPVFVLSTLKKIYKLVK